MLDADAYLGRRTWLPCPRCEDDCWNCAIKATCDLHWRSLLANEARLGISPMPELHAPVVARYRLRRRQQPDGSFLNRSRRGSLTS
jgi:hypothetical protein